MGVLLPQLFREYYLLFRIEGQTKIITKLIDKTHYQWLTLLRLAKSYNKPFDIYVYIGYCISILCYLETTIPNLCRKSLRFGPLLNLVDLKYVFISYEDWKESAYNYILQVNKIKKSSKQGANIINFSFQISYDMNWAMDITFLIKFHWHRINLVFSKE